MHKMLNEKYDVKKLEKEDIQNELSKDHIQKIESLKNIKNDKDNRMQQNKSNVPNVPDKKAPPLPNNNSAVNSKKA